MREYEVMYIINPELDEEKTDAVIEKFKSLIENKGGEITKLDKWGKKKLAYEIKHFNEGYYVVVKFKGDAAVASELDRVIKITDEIIKHMIIREEE